MGENILTQIERGRRVGYSDALIKKSLELDNFSPEAIKQGFKEAFSRKNGNGTKYGIKNVRIEAPAPTPSKLESEKALGDTAKSPEASPVLKVPKAMTKSTILLDILIGSVIFVIVGILMYLFLLPPLMSVI